MTDVIEGASVSVKTMADGTLRLTVDIEPRNANAAFALFGAPGRAMALAALKDGAGALNPGETFTGVSSTPVKPKGGEWAKLAGMWCNDPDFYRWIRPIYDIEMGGAGFGHGDLELGVCVNDEQDFCIHVIRFYAEIQSRVELDHDSGALRRFNDTLRLPFMAWMEEQGIQK